MPDEGRRGRGQGQGEGDGEGRGEGAGCLKFHTVRHLELLPSFIFSLQTRPRSHKLPDRDIRPSSILLVDDCFLCACVIASSPLFPVTEVQTSPPSRPKMNPQRVTHFHFYCCCCLFCSHCSIKPCRSTNIRVLSLSLSCTHTHTHTHHPHNVHTIHTSHT